MKYQILAQFLLLAVLCEPGQSFAPTTSASTIRSSRSSSLLPVAAAAKGFGAAPSAKKPNKKALLKQLEQTYGGTSPQDIARGTEQLIEKRMNELPPHMQLAIQIYRQLQPWNHRLRGMTLLQQAQLAPQEMEGAKRAQDELTRILDEHQLSEQDLHNLLQQMTWDASADAKAARSITGAMPMDIQKRIERGCAVVVEAMMTTNNADGRCLDVGCGFGVLVPFLKKAGLQEKQIYGVDLSPEMIRNAKAMYPGANFEAADFFQYDPAPFTTKFESIIFCSALHDLPDMMGALEKAAKDLLVDGGTMVVLHAQGASHVLNQVRSNPVLVQRGLPTAQELRGLEGLELLQEPAPAKSRQESQDGYLAVLQKSKVAV